MKKNRLILISLSVLLTGMLLVGSTGMTVIIKHCHSHGYSVSTGIFTTASPREHDCCNHFSSHCASEKPSVNTVSCCTFTTEKIKIANYTSPENLNKTIIFDNQPATYSIPVYELPAFHSAPLSYHNKHGGRDLLIAFRQFLI